MNYRITPFYSSFRRSARVLKSKPKGESWSQAFLIGKRGSRHNIKFQNAMFCEEMFRKINAKKCRASVRNLHSWQFFVLLIHIVCTPALSLLRINRLLLSYLVSKEVRVNALTSSCYFPFLEMCFLDRLRA